MDINKAFKESFFNSPEFNYIGIDGEWKVIHFHESVQESEFIEIKIE